MRDREGDGEEDGDDENRVGDGEDEDKREHDEGNNEKFEDIIDAGHNDGEESSHHLLW